MKKPVATILLVAIIALVSCTDKIGKEPKDPNFFSGKNVAILGDSYSTFGGYGYNPAGYLPYYPYGGAKVTKVEQTWWYQFIEESGANFHTNCSYGGSTFGNLGAGGKDVSKTSFATRVEKYFGKDRKNKAPIDIVFIMGGTNDCWGNVPLGFPAYLDIDEYGMTEKDYALSALCFIIEFIKSNNPGVRIINLVNMDNTGVPGSGINEKYTVPFAEVCAHYGIDNIELKDIEKDSMFHPTATGMENIKNQIFAFYGLTPGEKGRGIGYTPDQTPDQAPDGSYECTAEVLDPNFKHSFATMEATKRNGIYTISNFLGSGTHFSFTSNSKNEVTDCTIDSHWTVDAEGIQFLYFANFSDNSYLPIHGASGENLWAQGVFYGARSYWAATEDAYIFQIQLTENKIELGTNGTNYFMKVSFKQ